MGSIEKKKNEKLTIQLEAPDAVITGLLVLSSAERWKTEKEGLYTLTERFGGWHLLAFAQGSGWISDSGRTFVLKEGQAAAVPSEHAVSVLTREKGEMTVVSIQGYGADILLKESNNRGGLFFPNGGAFVRRIMENLEIEAEKKGGVSVQSACAAVYELLLHLYGTGIEKNDSDNRMPPVLEAAIRMMQQEFTFLDGVDELAGRLHVSQEYLTRSFREYMGVTPGKYLSRIRIEQAKQLLRGGGHTVSFIAEACGYTSSNYFARVFNRIVGMTPKQYQRSMETAEAGFSKEPDSFYVL